MLLINIFHNFCIFFGICFAGNLISKRFFVREIFNSHQKLCFEFIIGFILISFFLYFISLYNLFIIEFTIFTNLILIIFSIIYIYKKKINIKVSLNLNNFLLYFIIFIFFLSTLLPITDADTIAYHLEIPQKIIENKKLIFYHIDYHEIFYGPGEAIYLLGIIFQNYNLPQFINFIALMILLLNIQNLFEHKNYRSKSFLIFKLMSSPVVFQLLLTGKPQLIFISINTFLFSMLYDFSKKKKYITIKIYLYFFFYFNFYFINNRIIKNNIYLYIINNNFVFFIYI